MARRKYLWVAAGLIGGASLLVWSVYLSPSPQPLSAQPLTSKPDTALAADVPTDAGRTGMREAPKAALANASAPVYAPPVQAQGPYDLQSRLEMMQQRQQGRVYDPQQVASAVERKTAWTPVNRAPTSLPLKPEEFTDGRQFIKLDPLKMDSLMPGDEMWVRLQQNGTRYRVKIDSMESHGNGRVSSYGHLMDLSERYSVTFTRGPSLTVGGLDTPEGHYALQAHGEDGWIASSALLFKEHHDPIVPPEELNR